MKLTKAEQLKLLHALPIHRTLAVKTHCKSCAMKGEGISQILKSVGAFIGPLVKEIGVPVLKEFVLPFIKHKINQKIQKGKGISVAGGGAKKRKRKTK
jgi:hypothetical protein